jgi:hypothetical protein
MFFMYPALKQVLVGLTFNEEVEVETVVTLRLTTWTQIDINGM